MLPMVVCEDHLADPDTVYVTSLVLVCSRLASHVCIMFKFHLNLKWGFVKPSESFLEITQIKIAPKTSKKMLMLPSENIGQR